MTSSVGSLPEHGVGVQVADVGQRRRVSIQNALFQPLWTPLQDAALPVPADAERRLGVADVEEVAVDADHGVGIHHVGDDVP